MTGVVVKHTGLFYTVRTNCTNRRIICTLRGKFRLNDTKSTNPIAVGDVVDFELDENEKNGTIVNIHTRKNYIIRKSSNLSKQTHIVAANIDKAFLVVTLAMPETKFEFIDRFLLTTEAYHIPTIILINKIDIYNNEKLKSKLVEFKDIYTKAGYEIIEISATENKNIENLKALMKDNVCIFLGNSGVGKSALINCVNKMRCAKVGKISDAHKSGKHTTTFYEMFDLDFGGCIIDTPGLKGFGLIDDFSKEEIYHFFPEIFKYSENCKFSPCTHIHEPECAVIKAVKDGNIALSRYENYLKIIEDDNEKYRY